MFAKAFGLQSMVVRTLAGLLGAAWLLAPVNALAHKGSDAYLAVTTNAQGRADLRLAIALKDLDVVLPIDSNQDGQVTWGEVRAAAPVVNGYFSQAMSWSASDKGGTDCAPLWQPGGLERRSDGIYWIALTTLACQASALRLNYQLMAEADRSHRLLLSGEWRGQPLLATLAPGDERAIGSAQAEPVEQTPGATLLNYLKTGALHLLEGYDHLAFLLALVLPLHLPLRRPIAGVHVRPVTLSRTAPASDWTRMLSTISAFTLGHSVTLGLVAWGRLHVSSDWVEPAIVVSIGASALLNIFPVRWLRTELVAGVFGLVHGMGFAGLLLDAHAPLSLLPWALLGFNLGIEAAQLLVLLGWVLICQPLLTVSWYHTRFVRGISWALVAFSLVLLSRFAGWHWVWP